MIPINKIERSKIMKKFFLCLFLMLLFVGAFADEFSDKFQNKKWILEYYNEIIYKRDRNLLLNYIPKYRNQKETLFQRKSLLDECDYWCDTNSDSSIIYLLFDSFEIRDIKQISENCFYLFIGNGFIDTEKYNKNLENGCDWRNKEIRIESFYFKFDGDYLYIFLNDINNLLATYCAYDDNEYAALIRFLQTNNFSNNIISLPRHVDGTCDYEDENGNAVKDTGENHAIVDTPALGLEERINENKWLAEYYNTVLEKQNRNVLLDFIPKFKEEPFIFHYESKKTNNEIESKG